MGAGGLGVGKTNWQAQAGWIFPFKHNTARIMTTTTSRLDVNMQSVLWANHGQCREWVAVVKPRTGLIVIFCEALLFLRHIYQAKAYA